MSVTIGVLALQGGYQAHACCMQQLGCQTIYVRTSQQLARCQALIIPGGESTTLLHLLHTSGLTEPIATAIAEGLPIFGTCAGAILLAKQVKPTQSSLGCIDMTIERNAYGRQLDSFTQPPDSNDFDKGGDGNEDELIFIRAPRITSVGAAVKVLLTCQGDAVLVEQGCFLAATFHPELMHASGVHKYFLRSLEEMDRYDEIIQTSCT